METGMPVAPLMKIVNADDVLKIQVRWNGFSLQEDTLELLQNVYEDVPQMIERLLKRKTTPHDLAREARDALHL